MRAFNFLSYSLSIYCLLFLLLSQLPQSSASHSNFKNLQKSRDEPQFLQRRELSDLYFPCDAQSTCTKSISSDDTILLQLGSNAQYNLKYVISKNNSDHLSYLSKDNANEDFYINFESETMLSARIYLNESPFSDQIIFSTDNVLLRGSSGWTADAVILKQTLANNFGSILTIQVTNPNAEVQIVRISFSSGEVPVVGIALACIGGGILVLISLCCYVKRGKNSSSTNLARRNRQSAQSANNNTSSTNNSPNESTETVTPYLTEENMDNYFPEVKFENLKSTFVQTSCTICLEDMTKGMDCRQLYCEHIFHSECIKLWLKNQLPKKQACCPNCNKDMLQDNSRQ